MAAEAEIDVAYVANLARLQLTAEERALFQRQLEEVLNYVEQLRRADVGELEVAAGSPENAWRQDEPHPWLDSDEALANAPRKVRDLFIVPKLIE